MGIAGLLADAVEEIDADFKFRFGEIDLAGKGMGMATGLIMRG